MPVWLKKTCPYVGIADKVGVNEDKCQGRVSMVGAIKLNEQIIDA